MLKLPVIEIFLRLIPEAFLLVFAAHVIAKSSIVKKRYVLSSILFGTTNYFIRLLPIDYGIHSVLGIIIFVVLITNINKINVIRAIQAVLINTLIMFFCEGINVAIIQFVLKKDINKIFANPVMKAIYGVPSLLAFAGVIVTYYIITNRRKKLNYV